MVGGGAWVAVGEPICEDAWMYGSGVVEEWGMGRARQVGGGGGMLGWV